MKEDSFKISSQKTISEPNCSRQFPKKFIIVPGFFGQDTDKKTRKKYLDLIRAKLFAYEPEHKFDVGFLLHQETENVKSYLKSIRQPFIILLMREISVNDFILYEKFAKKNKHCKVYYEGKKENLLYYEEEEIEKEKISIRNVFNFEEKLEYFIMLTKKELDILAYKDTVLQIKENLTQN